MSSLRLGHRRSTKPSSRSRMQCTLFPKRSTSVPSSLLSSRSAEEVVVVGENATEFGIILEAVPSLELLSEITSYQSNATHEAPLVKCVKNHTVAKIKNTQI
uniref:Uncharacterized protein n=1 Tax=Steinernema glaseri TaxID=37863 RepID=A0A1I7Y0T7_9BILA